MPPGRVGLLWAVDADADVRRCRATHGPEIFGDVPRSIKRNADRRASQRADARHAARSTLTNGYYNLLLNLPWTLKEWDGPMQFEDPSGKAPRSRRDRPEISPDVRPRRRVDRWRCLLTTAFERS